MKLSKHASVRSQQRGIPPLIVEWLLEYGHRSPANGAIRVHMTGRSRRTLSRAVGKQVVGLLGKLLTAEAIIDPSTEAVITVQWRH